jgi:transcriptional regulator with XRE-family HTH domain
MDIGSRLTKFREAKGLSKNKLAKSAGVTQGFISQVESGNRLPTLEVLNRICSALGISLSEFFADDQEPEIPPDLRRILDTARRLTPRQRELLLEVMEEWASYNEGK